MTLLVLGGAGLLALVLLLGRRPRAAHPPTRITPSSRRGSHTLILVAIVLTLAYLLVHPEVGASIETMLAPLGRIASATMALVLPSDPPASPVAVPTAHPRPTPTPSPTPSPTPHLTPTPRPTVAPTPTPARVLLGSGDGLDETAGRSPLFNAFLIVIGLLVLLGAFWLWMTAHTRASVARAAPLASRGPDEEDGWTYACPECGQQGALAEYRYRTGAARCTSRLCAACAHRLRAIPLQPRGEEERP